MAQMPAKRYLGDSVYVECRGGMFLLTTENGYPDDPRNVIYLELEVYRALQAYADEALRQAASDSCGRCGGERAPGQVCAGCLQRVRLWHGDRCAACYSDTLRAQVR